MSSVDLIILGILLDRPMNAYELIHYVERNSLNTLLKISTPAIYKACKRLLKAGNLDGEIVREGEQPEKVVYSVNKNGIHYFNALMEHFSRDISPFFFEFNTFLWNIDKLDTTDALKKLEDLRDSIGHLKNGMIKHEEEVRPNASFPVRMILKQYGMIATVLVQWIEEVIGEYTETVN
jgi:DNA-binding PadR family transcriptional regulator